MKGINILVITPFYRWFIKDLVEAQSKYLHEAHVLVPYNPLVEISNYIPLAGIFDHFRLYTRKKIAELDRMPNNVFVHLVNKIYFVTPGRNKRAGDFLTKKFEEVIKKERIEFDLIHAHFIYPQGYIAVKLGQKFNVPIVITAHGHDVYEMPFRDDTWKDIITRTLNQADYVITVSQKNKNILVGLGIDKNRVSVIPNGVNLKNFVQLPQDVAREKLNLPKNKRIVLNVGNFYSEIKGHKYLIEAMKIITKYRRDIICIIVGDGRLKNKIWKQIKKANLSAYIRLVGSRPHKEIPLWMNAADIFVLPSLSEGNPTVMFEALGVGLPFVGTAVGGVPEIITSEDYGLLCEPANPKDLAEKILIALEKEWDREKIRKYAEQFTWENIAKEHFRIYQRALLFR